MGGIYSLWGAVVAGLFYSCLPALLDSWGLPADLLTILFGVGVLQVLLTAPAGIVDQLPKDVARLGRLIRTRLRSGDADDRDQGPRPCASAASRRSTA